MNMKAKWLVSGRAKIGLAYAGAMLLLGALACYAEVFSKRAETYEYEYAIDEGTWVQNALRERQIVADASQSVAIPAYGSQSNRLKEMKSILRGIIPAFVDNTKTSGDYLDWFSSPTGTTAGGCAEYPDLFPQHTVAGLLAQVGAPANYFEYTPWRPLDDQSIGEVTAQTAPGYTTTDYGWKYMRPILTNLKWTATVNCWSLTGRYSRVEGYALDDNNRPESTYGFVNCSYSASSGSWTPCYDWGELFPRTGEEETSSGNFNGCFTVEATKHNVIFSKSSSGNRGDFFWSESVSREAGEDSRVSGTGIISYCRKLPTNGVANLYLIRKGRPFSYITEERSWVGFRDYNGVGCSDSITNTVESSCWETASDMDRAAIIGTFNYPVSANYCFMKTNVALNPPAFNDMTELSETATAQTSVACSVNGEACSVTETRTTTEKYWYYRATITPGFLFKWSFRYN